MSTFLFGLRGLFVFFNFPGGQKTWTPPNQYGNFIARQTVF